MADERFNLINMFPLYKQAESGTNTIIFESQIDRGRFVVMSFFAEDDESTKDYIFLYLKNTNKLVKIKSYGNHSKGNFYIYLSDSLKKNIFEELQLSKGNGTFSLKKFMERLNDSIPTHISAESMVNLMSEHKKIVNQTGAVDDAEKIYFITIKKVTNGKAQDKTLRKLYMYTENNSEDIDLLIKILKKINHTTVWGKNNPNKNVNIHEWINKLS